MKTRQQRLTEARAGRPLSPPQSLPYNQRGPKRTRTKPSATVAAGSVVPAAQLAEEGKALSLLYVWVDAGPEAAGQPVDDPTHKLTIPSSSVPALIAFIENLRNQDKQSSLPAEEEHIPAMGSTDQDEGEAKQAEIEDPIAEGMIRSPSRAPATMNQNKRKRGNDEVGTPSTDVGCYGRGARGSYGGPEEDGATEERPGKIRRTREQAGFTSRVAEDPSTARQYVGLKAQHTTMEYQGGNVFTDYPRAAVPSPGHSNRGESKTDEEVLTAGLRAVTPSHQKNRELRSVSSALRPSELPEPEEILRPAEVEALRKLRDRVEKYKASLPPRRSSRA